MLSTGFKLLRHRTNNKCQLLNNTPRKNNPKAGLFHPPLQNPTRRFRIPTKSFKFGCIHTRASIFSTNDLKSSPFYLRAPRLFKCSALLSQYIWKAPLEEDNSQFLLHLENFPSCFSISSAGCFFGFVLRHVLIKNQVRHGNRKTRHFQQNNQPAPAYNISRQHRNSSIKTTNQQINLLLSY